MLFEGPQVQVSYSDPSGRGPHGFKICTCVIVLSADLEAELAEVSDAALQLVTAWEGLQREAPVPRGLPAP
jgi:hypothetical protein